MSALPATVKSSSLVARMGEKYGVEPNKMLETLKATAFRQKGNDSEQVSNEQMMALLVVAEEYGLNPFTKEIYAYPDKGGIVPVVGVDGWIRIINEHPQLDYVEFHYPDDFSESQHKGKCVYDWIEVEIKRKDRSRPVVVREYFDEVVRSVNFTTPWDSHPKRMHRHKALIQAARVAMGFGVIKDEDEADRILERDMGAVHEVGRNEIKMPKPAQRLENAASETLEQTLDVSDKVEVQPPAPSPAPRVRKAAAETQAANPASAATDNEKGYLAKKCQALGLEPDAVAEEVGVNWDQLSPDGFIAMKEKLAELERNV
jgi:phage recombination protein Bet